MENEVKEMYLEDDTGASLTKWKNPPKLRDLKTDHEGALSDHNTHELKIKGWLENFNVEGAAAHKAIPGRSKHVPKLIRKHGEWRYPALSEPFLSTKDMFKISPVSWEDRAAANQNQLLLNNQFNTKINKVAFIDEYVRTAVEEGTVILKTGWEFEEEEYDEEVPVFEFVANPEFQATLEQLMQMQAETPSDFMALPDHLKQAIDIANQYGQPMEPVQAGTEWVTKTKTLKNNPTVSVCDFRNVVIDPLAQGDIDKANFVIESFESSYSELKKDGRYTNLDNINIEQNSALALPDHATTYGSQTFNFRDKPRKKFVVYEYWGYWDIDGTGMVKPIVVSWVGNTIIRMEENPFPDKKLPYIIVQYLPKRKSNYGEPDGALLEDNQKILGAVTRGMLDAMGRSANAQMGVAKGWLDVTNRRKFNRGEDYEFNPNMPPNVAAYMHQFPELPQSSQFVMQLAQAEAESLTGVKSFNSGVSGASLGEVAAGVRGALDAASKRELNILRRLAEGVIRIGRKFISMNAAFLSDEEVVRITNEEFVAVKRDDLAGNFDLKLDITTAEEDAAKAQELAFMLQTMGNNVDFAVTKMILIEIARLRKMPDLAKQIENYQPQPDPMQQQLVQMQMQKLQMEIQELAAKAQSLGASAQLDQAKIGTEYAKQGNLQSDTDKKNLDFVEQESGVTQERNKELHGEQARSQMDLKLLESQLNKAEKQKDREYNLVKEALKLSKQKK